MSGKQSSLNLSTFLSFREKFQLLFNAVKFFGKLSFSRILRLNFSFHLMLIKSSVKLSFNKILRLNFHPLFNLEFQLS